MHDAVNAWAAVEPPLESANKAWFVFVSHCVGYFLYLLVGRSKQSGGHLQSLFGDENTKSDAHFGLESMVYPRLAEIYLPPEITDALHWVNLNSFQNLPHAKIMRAHAPSLDFGQMIRAGGATRARSVGCATIEA